MHANHYTIMAVSIGINGLVRQIKISVKILCLFRILVLPKFYFEVIDTFALNKLLEMNRGQLYHWKYVSVQDNLVTFIGQLGFLILTEFSKITHIIHSQIYIGYIWKN